MAITYEPIETKTLGSPVDTVTFSSIPGTYTDLVLIASITSDGAVVLRFNGDSGTTYGYTQMWGGTPYSQRGVNASDFYFTNASQVVGVNVSQVNVHGYANTTTFKSVLTSSKDARYDRNYAIVGQWRSTAAITSISLLADGNFATGAIFTLYGIKAA